MTKIRTIGEIKNKRKLVFFIIILLLSVFAIFTLPRLAAPFGLAYVLSLILTPLIPPLMKFGFKRHWSIVILFVGIALLLVYPIINVVPLITEESEKLSSYLPRIESHTKFNYLKLKTWTKSNYNISLPDGMVDDLFLYGKGFTKDILLQLPQFLASLAEWTFLIPLFLFFLLKDVRRMKFLVLDLTPNSIFERFYYLAHQFNKQIGDYIFAKFVEASIVGITITTGLLLMDVRFSLLLGLLAGVTNIIPYLGPILGAAPAIIFAFAEYGDLSSVGAITLLYLIANIIDLAIVFPILISKIVNLHPIVVVVSVILGSQYMGVIGMIISIPLAAAFKLVIIEIYQEIYD